VSEKKASAMGRPSIAGRPGTSLFIPIVLGFAMSLILAMVLYYALNDEFIVKRSIAVTPLAVTDPPSPLKR
jgi:hypothetical protein